MLKKNATAEQIAQDIFNYLSNYIKIKKMIMFGSYAYGKPREDSDMDFVVISDQLKNMDYFARLRLFADTALAVDSRIELQGYTEIEYEHAPNGTFIKMIKDRGKEMKFDECTK